MKELRGLRHLFVCSFLFAFSNRMVLPAMTDITLEAICPGNDHCSLAIYLSGFQQAVRACMLSFSFFSLKNIYEEQLINILYILYVHVQIVGLGALVVTPVVGNLSDKFGRKALLSIPITVVIPPAGIQLLLISF